MIYFAYFIFGFSILQLLIALVNFVFKQRFTNIKPSDNDLVSILIPARNEEKNISIILDDLVKQDYQNIEIIVFDDQSTDATAQIIEQFTKQDNRIKLVHSEGLPDGWLGKNYACYCLSKSAKGKYLLFIDADVRIYKDIINSSLHHLKTHQLGLLSIFPKQIMKTLGEKFTVPLMNYILLTLLPLILVRKSGFNSFAAANGQYMLFETETYKKLLPHEKMKNKKVEDIEISRLYKTNKIKIACITGKENICCRMYPNYPEAVNGFSKNINAFFGNSFVVAFAFWLITTFGFIVLINSLSSTLLIIYFILILFTRSIVSLTSNQNIVENILYFIPQQLSLGYILVTAVLNQRKKSFVWKARNIS